VRIFCAHFDKSEGKGKSAYSELIDVLADWCIELVNEGGKVNAEFGNRRLGAGNCDGKQEEKGENKKKKIYRVN